MGDDKEDNNLARPAHMNEQERVELATDRSRGRVAISEDGGTVRWKTVLNEWGLYSPVQFAPDTLAAWLDGFRQGPVGVDALCLGCERESHFRRAAATDWMARQVALGRQLKSAAQPQAAKAFRSAFPAADMPPVGGDFAMALLTCARDARHQLVLLVRVASGTLEKVGQSPSLADLQQHFVSDFEQVLPEEEYRQLRRGVGLFAHGIGIGAIVYLRRTIEWLLQQAERRWIETNPGCDLPYPGNTRTQERIKALDGYLPAFLVENAFVYGTVSAAIHSLSEEDAKALFPVILAGIRVALGELAARQRGERERQQAARALADAHGMTKRLLDSPDRNG